MKDIELLRELFINRDDCYPQQKEGVNEYFVIKKPISDDLIRRHLEGSTTIGSFQIDNKTNTVKWICFDFDGELDTELEKAKKLYQKLKEKGYSPLIEFSGRRGYHIWLFLEKTDAKNAKKFATDISKGMGISDIYPKQEKVEIEGFGGQVKIPLGIHRASGKRSYFLNEKFQEMTQEDSINLLRKIYGTKRDKIHFTTLKDFI